MADEPELSEVLFAFIWIGKSVKVSAVDPASATEVSIVGPANAPRRQLELTALRKLKYVMAKKSDIL